MTDPIADMLTRIRNAGMVKKRNFLCPMSNIKFKIAQILEKEGWLKKVEVVKSKSNKGEGNAIFDELMITLNYKKNGKHCIRSLKRVSRPGLRVYVKKNEIPKVLNDFGISIISTPKGIMTGKEAKSVGVGGELICEIY